MKILLIRHAETDYPQEKVVGEFPGPPLSKRGFEQAKRLAFELSNERPELVFSSDLKRAIQTLNAFNFLDKSIVRIDSRIREVDDIITGYSDKNTIKESEQSQCERLASFLQDLQTCNLSHIWVVCHFNVIEHLSQKLGQKIVKPRHATKYELNLDTNKISFKAIQT